MEKSYVIFLCAGGDADDVSDDMKDFLDWLTGKEGREQGRIDTLITFLENGGTVSEAKKMLAVSDEDIRIAESRGSAISPSQKNSKV